jgi:uncharacterized membrane protein affecting hemolysin expression
MFLLAYHPLVHVVMVMATIAMTLAIVVLLQQAVDWFRHDWKTKHGKYR